MQLSELVEHSSDRRPLAPAPPAPTHVELGPAVDCLCCGGQRLAAFTPAGRLDAGECPYCGYVGWVRAGERDKLRRRVRALTVLPFR